MITPEKYDQLLALFRGQLHGAAREELEAELQSNPTLQADYEDLIFIEKLTVEHKLAEVETISQQSFVAYRKKEVVKKGSIALLGLLGVAAIGYYFYPSPEKEALKLPTKGVQTITETVIEPEKSIEVKEPIQKKARIEAPLQQLEKPTTITIVTSVEEEKKTLITIKTESAADNTSLVEEKSKQTKTVDPCLQNPLQVSTKPEATCPDEANGKVIIKTSGGTPPITQKVVDLEQNEYSTNYLEQGNYQVLVEDSKHCKSTIRFTIEEKVCATDYDFNPSQGQTLRFDNTVGLLQILTKTGHRYFEIELDENSNFEWNGRNNKEELIPGFYTYRVLSQQKEVKFGTITITQ